MKRWLVVLLMALGLLLIASPAYAFTPPNQGTDNATDVVVWHGDDLTITNDALTDAATEISVAFQGIAQSFGLIISLLLLVFLSALGFWRPQAVLSAAVWIIAGGVSICLGLYWYDVFTNDMGLSVSLMLITYWLVCWGYGFAQLFASRNIEGSE